MHGNISYFSVLDKILLLPFLSTAITTAIPTLASSSPSTTANPNDNEYPENAVVYDVNILVVDDVPPQQRSNFYEQIESQLLVRAVNTLPGYHSVR